ncbi:phosphocholine cytidylyltransferase family protein [Roseovarius pelagicus]|uniref:Phosphocholine cytidylyltransferase family protein n=1 Tax=Roseovarius pelagicus TaxID=2980108 RepID=A0ABY6D667_9RHOB|nr:phosphocholine cytidylyltransferase family protein [Roseovarius pelagicus]UXX81593.1 phosphocholine cytidylyltransferase family protein [Roseovarius pelagicus]
MKTIILAAGQGSRLRPLTDDRPKSMVALGGKPLLVYQLEAMQAAGIAKSDIAIVTGYRKEHQEALGYKTFVNPEYMTTNMVYSLFCADEWMDETQDLLIAYGDIVYDKGVLETLFSVPGDVVLTADTSWQKLWAARAEDFLADAETFRISEDGLVTEVGQRPQSLADIDAQYMGLIKISADKIAEIKTVFAAANAAAEKTGADVDNMYMTDFLNDLIEAGWRVRPALISGHWIEVDTVGDLELYQGMLDPARPGDLSPLFHAILAS